MYLFLMLFLSISKLIEIVIAMFIFISIFASISTAMFYVHIYNYSYIYLYIYINIYLFIIYMYLDYIRFTFIFISIHDIYLYTSRYVFTYVIQKNIKSKSRLPPHPTPPKKNSYGPLLHRNGIRCYPFETALAAVITPSGVIALLITSSDGAHFALQFPWPSKAFISLKLDKA